MSVYDQWWSSGHTANFEGDILWKYEDCVSGYDNVL